MKIIPSLERVKIGISPLGSYAIALNGVIGAGVFALPAVLAAKAGNFSPWYFLVAAAIFLPLAYSLGRVARHFEGTGGSVVYTRHAFGPFVSFQTGWIGYLSAISAMAANTAILMSYAGSIYEPFREGWGRVVAIVVLWLIFTVVNILGVREGVRWLTGLTYLKILPLLFIAAWGGLFGSSISPVFGFEGHSLGFDALLVACYAYIGFEGAVVPAKETRNATQVIPKVLVYSIAAPAVLYFFLQSFLVVNNIDLGGAKAPLIDMGQIFWGPVGATVMTLTAIFSVTGNLAAGAITIPRVPYVLAYEKQIPAIFSQMHEKYLTPWVSIVLTGVLIVALAIPGTFVMLATMAVLSRFISYALSILSLASLEGPKSLLGIPMIAIAICVYAIVQAQAEAWMTLAGFILTGTLMYGLLNFRRKRFS